MTHLLLPSVVHRSNSDRPLQAGTTDVGEVVAPLFGGSHYIQELMEARASLLAFMVGKTLRVDSSISRSGFEKV